MPQNRDDPNDPNPPGGPPPADWWEQNRPPPTIVANPGETHAQTLERYRRDYHAPDRAWVLAAIQSGRYTTGAPAEPSGGGGGGPFPEGDLTAHVTALFRRANGRDPAPSDIAYWVGKYNEAGGGPNAYLDARMGPDGGRAQGYGDAGTYGAPPPPYQSQGSTVPAYQTEPLPEWLKTPYVAPTFTPPTGITEQNDPGYQARAALAQQGLERSAAARGTILSGGFQQELAKYNQEYASNEFSNVYGRALNSWGANTQAGLAGRQQQVGEYMNTVGNRYNQYGQQYSAYLNDQSRRLQDYLTNYNIGHTAQTDYWGRLQDVANRGRPPFPTVQ